LGGNRNFAILKCNDTSGTIRLDVRVVAQRAAMVWRMVSPVSNGFSNCRGLSNALPNFTKNNIRLADWDPDDTQEFSGDKLAAQQALTDMQAKLVAQQEMLYADGSQRLLVVLQAMDTGGKDGSSAKCLAVLTRQGCMW
jgi:hypothetical protein